MQGFYQKRPVHYNVFALFLLTESLLHMAEQSAIVNGMTQGNEAHEAVWQDLVQENIDGAKEMGVQFYTIDKTAFIEATQSLRDEFCAKSADNARYYEDFLSYVQA